MGVPGLSLCLLFVSLRTQGSDGLRTVKLSRLPYGTTPSGALEESASPAEALFPSQQSAFLEDFLGGHAAPSSLQLSQLSEKDKKRPVKHKAKRQKPSETPTLTPSKKAGAGSGDEDMEFFDALDKPEVKADVLVTGVALGEDEEDGDDDDDDDEEWFDPLEFLIPEQFCPHHNAMDTPLYTLEKNQTTPKRTRGAQELSVKKHYNFPYEEGDESCMCEFPLFEEKNPCDFPMKFKKHPIEPKDAHAHCARVAKANGWESEVGWRSYVHQPARCRFGPKFCCKRSPPAHVPVSVAMEIQEILMTVEKDVEEIHQAAGSLMAEDSLLTPAQKELVDSLGSATLSHLYSLSQRITFCIKYGESSRGLKYGCTQQRVVLANVRRYRRQIDNVMETWRDLVYVSNYGVPKPKTIKEVHVRGSVLSYCLGDHGQMDRRKGKKFTNPVDAMIKTVRGWHEDSGWAADAVYIFAFFALSNILQMTQVAVCSATTVISDVSNIGQVGVETSSSYVYAAWNWVSQKTSYIVQTVTGGGTVQSTEAVRKMLQEAEAVSNSVGTAMDNAKLLEFLQKGLMTANELRVWGINNVFAIFDKAVDLLGASPYWLTFIGSLTEWMTNAFNAHYRSDR
uniref:Uncharacterized protein n=1 Tax=Chromera velia CCMP2878 TaxID=1169474 RepID=A0A0G4FE27_9ALVE|eukprot:Cvel_16428.t1-p1 / transcript=Cvel_16428.t1 / gene=Cvel_16428 / organism=Chromera_velia_CCMP2878 / gene_product=hypothetical protein / transcript_product=hypothetical protein / location=Cvel_scaffold1266:3691-8655(+) / protein_length=621 / sequence_SO=supercontig / SO=protein_coding / is_pseudo=false